MPQRFHDVTGFVLAGGASLRMGRPKAALTFGGETMLERQVRLLRSVSRTVEVIGPAPGAPDREAVAHALGSVGVAIVPDALPGRGPLVGIYTGLMHTHTEFNFFLGCDLPFMEARFLRFLVQQALSSAADATTPHSADRRVQPLVAVYRRRALPAVRTSLESGENKVTRFYPRVRRRAVRWAEIARAGFSSRIFDNINTPEDYERAVRRREGSSV